MEDRDNPKDIWELSRDRYERALDHVEAVLRRTAHDDADVLNEMRIVRMVGCHRVPWYGMTIDPEDSSVDVGVVLRNAFEALGDWLDGVYGDGPHTKAATWFARRYLPLWRRGKHEYHEWLDTLGQERPPEAKPGVDRPDR